MHKEGHMYCRKFDLSNVYFPFFEEYILTFLNCTNVSPGRTQSFYVCDVCVTKRSGDDKRLNLGLL